MSLGDIILTNKDIIKKSSFQYVQSRCFEQCKYTTLLELCNKTEFFSKNLQYSYTNQILFYTLMEYEYKTCDPSLFIDIFKRNQNEGINGICKDVCPPECNLISYSLTFTDI